MVFPSDPFVSDDVEFMCHIDRALEAVSLWLELTYDRALTLIRIKTGYGWVNLASREQLSTQRSYDRES